MSGNTTSLYSTSSSNGTTGSNNFTTLYPSTQGVIIPTTPYGNANVVALLAAGSDGGNTVANIVATGNISGNVFIGNGAGLTNIPGGNIVGGYGNAQVASFLNAFGSNSISTTGNVTANNAQLTTVYHNGTGVAIQSNAWAQLQYSNSISAPVDQTNIGTGSWFYVDPDGAVWESNTTGTLRSVVMGNDGTVSAQGNITAPYYFGNGSQLTGLPATYSNANVTSLLASFGSNVISTTGNITSGNLLTPGLVSAAGNVTGTYILGNGSQLTGLPATYSNANVTSLLANFGSNVISTTGNITAGNFITPGKISATGNISTQGYFIGTFLGNIVGNLIVPGANTQVLYNNNGNADASAGFTFNSASNAVVVTGNISAANISTTGNVTGTYILGNGSQLTGLPATYGNANVANFLPTYGGTVLANLINFTNNSGIIEQGDQRITITGNAIGVNTGAYFNDTGEAAIFANSYVAIATNTIGNVNPTWTFDAVGNLSAPGAISAVGNVTASYFIGNGSQLTGLPAGYSNANVASFLANFGSNSISTTGNITAGNLFGNGAGLTSITGANVTGTVANATYATSAGSAGSANTAVTVTGNAQANITSVGVLTSLSSTGNIDGANINGNGSGLSSITGANVTGTVANATYATSAGSATTAGTVTANAQANITSVGVLTSLSVLGNTISGNILTGGQVSATGNVTGNYLLGNGAFISGLPAGYSNADVASFLANFGSNSISTTGNVTAGYFVGNGSLLSNITGANVTGTVANATYAVSAGSADTANTANLAQYVTGNAQANITSVGVLTSLSVSGNTTTGNMLTSGIVSATGNITGNYFIGNGSQLTGISAANVTAAGANTQIQYNNANAFAGNAAMVFDNTTGNVTLSTLIIGNTTAGNANGATRVNTTATFVGQNSGSQTLIAGQIVIGNGYFGSFSNGNTPAGATKGAKVVIWDSVNLAAGNRYSSLQTMSQIIVANNNGQAIRGVVSHMQFGGGANSNISSTQASGAIGVNQVVFVGGGPQQSLIGNTVATGTTAALASITVSSGSNLLTGIGVAATPGTNGASGGYAAGVMGNAVGLLTCFQLNAIPTAVYGYYFSDAVTNPSWGYSSTNTARSAPSYYSIYNADAVAQNQLGSLRAYHTFQYTGNTTGTWNIDKNLGQVQYIIVNGNVTIGSYTNFVTTASNSVSNLNQTDTVTLIIEQGATPYTVTMPTGNAAIRYANGVSTVTATANSTTMIAITAYRTVANAASYLTTISPAFT